MSATIAIGAQNTEHSAQEEDIGATARTRDGRLWRYAENAGTALSSGRNLSQATPVGNHDADLAVATTAAAEASSVDVTLGATASTLDYYKDGYLYVNDNGSEGSLYIISGNAATASAGTQTVPLQDENGLTEALTAGTDQVGLIQNLWKDVVVFPTTVTGAPVGLATINVTADYFFWTLIAGVGNALCDLTTHAIGAPIEPSAAAAGAVDLFDRSGTVDAPQIGVTMGVLPVDTEFHLFNLLISA